MLADALVQVSFSALLIFARVGSLVMLLPGIGEGFVPPRIRLAFAFMFAIALAPVLSRILPELPPTAGALGMLVGNEIIIGLMIGVITRFFLAAVAVAGQIIGMQTGLAFAQAVDPTLGQQGATAGAFLNITALALLFASNLHHILLAGIRNSYNVFPAGQLPPAGDASQWALDTFADVFMLGVQMASPLLVFGLVFYLALGVLSRLMPQAQIFFIALPSNILIGFSILAIVMGASLLTWLDRFETFARQIGG